jgi:uncharacterized protein (DUF302 family)
MKTPKGILQLPSPFSVSETIDRLETFLKAHGATIYARIDQMDEVRKTGKVISPLQFLLFGNPKVGGLVMEASALSALDLPLKIIAFQDADDKVWIAFNEADYIKARYELSQELTLPLDLKGVVAKALG